MTETAVAEIVARALAEDVGSGDLTSAATVPEAARARAVITQKAPGVVFGLDAAEATFRALDPDVLLQRLTDEGRWRERGEVLQIEGSARALLTAERTALNFLQRLSGVATLAARCVEAVDGTGARILDTRKTTPGLRSLEKAAVAAGGATNHRAGLYDAILIKENHATLAEVDEALGAGAPRILLDNMTVEQLRDAVLHVAGRAELEASGGVTLQTL